jgi:hypothetical protein
VVDHVGSTGGHFLLVDSNHEIKDPPMTTELFSPMLISAEHPVECLVFWFQLPVKITQELGARRLELRA